MDQVTIAGTELKASPVGYGCMRIRGQWSKEPVTQEEIDRGLNAVKHAFEAGINFFDHADIYSRGRVEELFSHLWDRGVNRDSVILQSKCGIKPDIQGYDFSYEHIIASVEGILQRLRTDYLDILLLHRPDVLMEPEEVARAFDDLETSGKVRHFGVSNFTPAQISLLNKTLDQKIICNQIRLSLLFNHAFNSYIVAGGNEEGVATRGEGILEYCMENNISVQAYNPLAGGRVSGKPFDDEPESVREVASLVESTAVELNVSREAILLAWLMRHPAHIHPIIGTTKPERIDAALQALNITLSRKQWYALFNTARGGKVP